MKEIWKDIPGYEACYQVSNLGRVKSLCRKSKYKNTHRLIKERILKPNISTGYRMVNLYKGGQQKVLKVSVLVAMAFLNHKPNGHELIVDHINFIKTDDRLENLQIITSRKNTSRSIKAGSSKYTGVSFHKASNKYRATAFINGQYKHIGCFVDEYKAHLAYKETIKNNGIKSN